MLQQSQEHNPNRTFGLRMIPKTLESISPPVRSEPSDLSKVNITISTKVISKSDEVACSLSGHSLEWATYIGVYNEIHKDSSLLSAQLHHIGVKWPSFAKGYLSLVGGGVLGPLYAVLPMPIDTKILSRSWQSVKFLCSPVSSNEPFSALFGKHVALLVLGECHMSLVRVGYIRSSGYAGSGDYTSFPLLSPWSMQTVLAARASQEEIVVYG
ncbi:hypothetical protein Tco_0312122 [Tanacetum coccineum]